MDRVQSRDDKIGTYEINKIYLGKLFCKAIKILF